MHRTVTCLMSSFGITHAALQIKEAEKEKVRTRSLLLCSLFIKRNSKKNLTDLETCLFVFLVSNDAMNGKSWLFGVNVWPNFVWITRIRNSWPSFCVREYNGKVLNLAHFTSGFFRHKSFSKLHKKIKRKLNQYKSDHRIRVF